MSSLDQCPDCQNANRSANEPTMVQVLIPERKTDDESHCFLGEYPDDFVSGPLDAILVRGNHGDSSSPSTPGCAYCHRRTGTLCPSPFWAVRGDRFCCRPDRAML